MYVHVLCGENHTFVGLCVLLQIFNTFPEGLDDLEEMIHERQAQADLCVGIDEQVCLCVHVHVSKCVCIPLSHRL